MFEGVDIGVGDSRPADPGSACSPHNRCEPRYEAAGRGFPPGFVTGIVAVDGQSVGHNKEFWAFRGRIDGGQLIGGVQAFHCAPYSTTDSGGAPAG